MLLGDESCSPTWLKKKGWHGAETPCQLEEMIEFLRSCACCPHENIRT